MAQVGTSPIPTGGTTEPVAASRGRVRVEPGHKRVRGVVGGVVVADTIRPWLVWEMPYYPVYYLPQADLHAALVDTGQRQHSPSRGDGHLHDLVMHDGAGGQRTLAGVASTYPDSPIEALRDLVRLEWAAIDQWFEEDELVYTHPRDPYTRVDILASSRHVQVVVDGVTVADSVRPHLLFETGLPVRYYLPLTDVRMDLLRPSDTVTQCPYKGQAGYYSVEVGGVTHADLVWTYRTPLPECVKIAGLVAFLDEQVDVYVDGVQQQRPRRPGA